MALIGARAEAWERVGRRWDVRVLEPSPPAVNEPPNFADDPVAGGEVVPLERPGARSWESVCRDAADPDLDAWCAHRWLVARRRLEALPAAYSETRQALHALAEHVIAPARYHANGKIGLRFTRAGFGTPFFGTDRQVRIQHGDLVVEGDGVPGRRVAVTTVAAAAALVGIEPGAPTGIYTATNPLEPDRPLAVDAAAADGLGDWYGFCASVLEQFRSESDDGSLLQLWPEHFDLAVDLGNQAAGQRANYGGSPGDAAHPEPYLYIGPWVHQVGEFWAESFGARLSYAQLAGADDQRGAALAFLRQGRSLLAPGG